MPPGPQREPLPANQAPGPVIQVEHLTLHLRGSDGRVLPVLQDISFVLPDGQCLGMAGESGSGKTVLAMSILGLIQRDTLVLRAGSIRLHGHSLEGLDEKTWASLRGARMAMVFQEPLTALNPLMTVYQQIAETVTAHHPGLSADVVRQRVFAAFQRSGFPEPEKFADSYPHQLSGGMRQRALLAMSLVLDPTLLIADEPTTALDAALQLQLLRELRKAANRPGHAMIFVSHDLGAIRAVSDLLAVLYAGVLVEFGTTADVLRKPYHPYTQALIRALPGLTRDTRMPVAIPGMLPAPDQKPVGCVFSERCPLRQPRCNTERPTEKSNPAGRRVCCHFPLVPEEIGAVTTTAAHTTLTTGSTSIPASETARETTGETARETTGKTGYG